MIAPNGPLQGTSKGNTIVLERETGLPDGARVSVTVNELRRASADMLLRLAGAWADAGDELDEFLAQVRHDRKAFRREIDP